MSADIEVRKASEENYAVMNRMLNGDAAPLASIWSHSAAVSALHPIGGRQVGWDEVRKSFEQVSQIASNGQVELQDRIVQVAGDMAYEVGVERGQLKLAGTQVNIDHRVTNIYRREAGGWKIVHHHTDLSPAMLAVLGLMNAKT
jgi:ketosteroid isomerase-like protein